MTDWSGQRWRDPSWWRGCLLAGAAGDALGAPLESKDWLTIRARYGPHGLADLAPHAGRRGAITDDTQMTLFTAEAVLGYLRRGATYGVASLERALHYSYLRWLVTQGETPPSSLPRPLELRGLLWDCPSCTTAGVPAAPA